MTNQTNKPLFTAEDFQAIGAKAFNAGQSRPVGDTWQAKAKQWGFDKAQSDANAQTKFFDTPEQALVASSGSGDTVQADASLQVKSMHQLLEEKQALDDMIQKETTAALETVRNVIAEYGFSVQQVFTDFASFKPVKGNKGAKVQPKYRDHATGAVWSGRGLAPAWIKGQDKTKFLIQS